jgi:hypothetical protein
MTADAKTHLRIAELEQQLAEIRKALALPYEATHEQVMARIGEKQWEVGR